MQHFLLTFLNFLFSCFIQTVNSVKNFEYYQIYSVKQEFSTKSKKNILTNKKEMKSEIGLSYDKNF